jgi:hypothetical protein
MSNPVSILSHTNTHTISPGWITFAVAGVMQGILLVMCITWKLRQRKLKLDDFGQPLSSAPLLTAADAAEVVDIDEASEETPLLHAKKKGDWRRWRRWMLWFKG